MGDDSLILREDGYIRMNFPVTSLTYHSNLNVILVKTDAGGLHVLDVNSGVVLQSTDLSSESGLQGVEYAAGADRVFVWDEHGVGARTDYNGVLLLHTALQRPLPTPQSDKVISIELVLSEAVLLYQCLQTLDVHSIEGLSDFINALKNAIEFEPVQKGVKAQKWSTVTVRLPQSTIRLVASGVVVELKSQSRRIPALAVAAAVGHRAGELTPRRKVDDPRAVMYSEAERKHSFKRWPHMDYKFVYGGLLVETLVFTSLTHPASKDAGVFPLDSRWALPARMAQAGFFHQPSSSGNDRVLCFTCMICLVCWEKADEPWVEHERHSPNCSFVRGEYTHNVPISVTNATACAVPSPNVSVVSRGNTGDLIATGTSLGKVNVWRFECGLKLVKFIHLSPYDSIFSGILPADNHHVWSGACEKDTSTYALELTALAFLGMSSQPETHTHSESSDKESNTSRPKPSLVCAVTVTRIHRPTDEAIKEDTIKALFDFKEEKSQETVKAMNDQNEAKSNKSNNLLFLLTYDIHSSSAGSITTVVHTSNSSGNSKPGGSKKVSVARTDEANIYDEIFLQYSDDDTDLPQCTNTLIEDQIGSVINLNASSSKEDSKIWQPNKIIFTKHFKVLPSPPSNLPTLLPELTESGKVSVLDFVGQQLKSWKSGTLDSVGTKVADQPDAAVVQQTDPLSHYLNMNGPLEIPDLKWYEHGDGSDKVKVTTIGGGSKLGTQIAVSNSNNGDGYDSDPPPEEIVTQGVAIQCLGLPSNVNFKDDSKVTHLYPTEDGEHLLIVISNIDLEKIKCQKATSKESENSMDVDEVVEQPEKKDCKSYLLLYKINNKTSNYTLEENPLSVKELPYSESPVDICLLPPDKQEQYAFAAVGIDGGLRLYAIPDFKVLSEKHVLKGQFTSVVYCASVDRLSVSTKNGVIYFYALNNSEKDSTGDADEDEFANLDFDMLRKAGIDDICGPPPHVIIANKTELDVSDMDTLLSLTGTYGPNTTVPYSAVVPGFWCELSPAQRSRSERQNNRTWRLQNTSSTWDEHVLELTLPYTVFLAHIEFGFTLHSVCSANLPLIQVTLLKQNLHGIGYKKDAFDRRPESPVKFSVADSEITNVDNPVNSEEYLQAHNAEILAGPLLLSSGLDMTQQSGTLILTSPRLYRSRGRTFLIHIKTLFDPSKDMAKDKSEDSSTKKSNFIGCDWLHQISITVRSCTMTEVRMEHQQRITMLESNNFLNMLCGISVSKESLEKRLKALDLIIWVTSIRLQRLRVAKSKKGKEREEHNPVEAQQLECIRIIEKHTDALVKNCILCADRSLAKKAIKILLITSEGVKQLPRPWKYTFEQTLTDSISGCIPYLGACESPGALRWFAALATHATSRDVATRIVTNCLGLLQQTANCLSQRANVYHNLLRARFGLYGLPLEKSIFATDVPELGKGSSTPVTYASVLAGDPATIPQTTPDYQLKDLLNLPVDSEAKPVSTSGAWWAQNNAVSLLGAGLSEVLPLHVTCHVASDGTKLECSGVCSLRPPVVSALPTDANQLWTVVKEGQLKGSHDPDSLEDVESTLMDCDPQEKTEYSEEKLFKEAESCGIGWAGLVARPPQHTLVVERMQSGARRYIVLALQHTVRLTDVIIPSCPDLVTLGIDIWVNGEDTDCEKLAYATDIATKHLVLTDIQPPPLARFIKITTIGRYGMSAMKCKIPLGWFFGDIADVSNVQASNNALLALQEDLGCRFRLANGKLMDLLNPYLELYNGNASHMMTYLNLPNEPDLKVVAAYQECIELQQQLHTCKNILKKTQNSNETFNVFELINKGELSPQEILERSSTDKLRVIMENVVDMLLHFFFQLGDMQNEEVSLEWCQAVTPLLSVCGASAAAALGTLLARLCGTASWWGHHLADTLTNAFIDLDAPPTPLDRCLVLVMYMCRKSMYSHSDPEGGVAQALSERALELLRAPSPQPAATAAVLTALASVLDAATADCRHNRWDWVTGGRPGSGGSAEQSSRAATPPRSEQCKFHRRKLHKKLFHHMQELEAARRGIQVALHEQQRVRLNLKARMAMLNKRDKRPDDGSDGGGAAAGVVSPPLAAALAHALVQHVLTAGGTVSGDQLLLAAKVVGRLCTMAGGAALLEGASVLGLARLAVTLPPWPRHALTTLLQDLVEYESGDFPSPDSSDDQPSGSSSGAGSSRVIRVSQDDIGFVKASRKAKFATVADVLADSFGLVKESDFGKPKIMTPTSPNSIKVHGLECQLSQVAESDDSETEEKLEQYFLDAVKKVTKVKPQLDNSVNNISSCIDARLESGPAAACEAACRRLLVAGGGVLAAAIRALPPRLVPPATTLPPTTRHHPPLSHTLYDVFRHLALELPNQLDCSLLENMVSLWLTLNGAAWSSGAWGGGAVVIPPDAPRIRLASDTVAALLQSLCQLENITLRCWTLSLQALAWISGLPLQTEGNNQLMGRVILECEHLVPAIVKFVTLNVNGDGAVSSSEPYLGGTSVGAGAGAASALQSFLSRVVAGRGATGAGVALRSVCGAWRALPPAAPAYDLHTALLRAATPLVQLLTARHAHHALPLIDTVAQLSSAWVRESSGVHSEAATDARLSSLLSDVLGGTPAARGRAPLRRSVLALLLHYCRKLLTIPAPDAARPSSSSSEQSQTDESKAAHSANLEDERKALRPPTLADTVLQNPQIMQKFYRTLMLCDGMNPLVLSSAMNADPPTTSEYSSLQEEVFWLVVHMASVASTPSLMLSSLIQFLRGEEIVNLSQGMQQLLMRLLDKPEPLAAFIEGGGLELAVEKLVTCHQAGPSNGQGLVSSLMNYLKLPPQILNMSTSANNKKSTPPAVETPSGLINVAPLCTISCGNPTAQAADVLLGGGSGSTGSGAGACAARRVRAAAWSYHFFSADEPSLAMTLTLPHAAQLHEVHLQPHLTSLATCPGAVAVEAGVGSTLAPLGPPQNTSGMTFIRLVVSRPVVCTTVQLRLYKPRDSSNMGLLSLKLLAAPAFNNQLSPNGNTNKWSHVLSTCTRAPLPASRWSSVLAAPAVRALSCVLAGGGAAAHHAHHTLLQAAIACPDMRATLLTQLLHADNFVYSHVFHPNANRSGGSVSAVCELVRQICVCGERRDGQNGALGHYLRWLRHCRQGRHPPQLIHTLAEVLWTMKQERIHENLEELITDDLFNLVFSWVQEVPDNSPLKKSLDAVLCSMCYIRPELFRKMLRELDIPMDTDDSMEGLTDDTKVHGGSVRNPRPYDAATQLPRVRSVPAAAMSPAAALALLHSALPTAVVLTIAEYSEAKLRIIKQQLSGSEEDVHMEDADKQPPTQSADKGVPVMESIRKLVDWCRQLCWERRFKDWLGSDGAVFWTPLLTLLCHPRPRGRSWLEEAEYPPVEEATVCLFAELTSCHVANQKRFATTLHSILENMQYNGPEGISGFTRSLILRLVLSGERAWVGVKWAGPVVVPAPRAPPAHPAAVCHALLSLPTTTTIRSLLSDHRLPMLLMDEATKSCVHPSSSGSGSVLRSASDTAIMTLAEAWELSLAAGSASKDKRVKDVKNTSLKQQVTKKKQGKAVEMNVTLPDSICTGIQEMLEGGTGGCGGRVTCAGVEGVVAGHVTLAQLLLAAPHTVGPQLMLTVHLHVNQESWAGPTWDGGGTLAADTGGGGVTLREFGACGGLALVAARLPRPAPAPMPPHTPHHQHHDLDWVKLDDPYEEVVEMGGSGSGGGGGNDETGGGVPAHALAALALLLKLSGYATALLEEGPKAVHLLRLLLGVTADEEGRNIVVSGGSGGTSWSLGTLPFVVVARLLERHELSSAEGKQLRRALVTLGAVRLILACLAVFTHHKPTTNDNSQTSNGSSLGKSEDKPQLYWAKGTGFGTGSTQQSWNVEQALVRQRTEEEHVTVLLQVLASYMNPGEKWPPEDSPVEERSTSDSVASTSETDGQVDGLSDEFIELVANSSMVPAICSYLRNDSVLDMSRHIPLYVSVLRCARALLRLRRAALQPALRPLPQLLLSMSRTTNSYATKLRMNKKNSFGKMTYNQRFNSSINSELSEEDEGLASLIADIQATSALLCRTDADGEAAGGSAPRLCSIASREARYIQFMRNLQFETFEMIVECSSAECGFKFTVPYHFEGTVKASGERAHPARMKRLAQEAATLATSLPLSYSSSVFVRTDTDRLDVMKVLITGPSDTPYANGCFVLDVYFPAEYPAVPMLINLETTGRRSVRFNPNLYNDGKVCLSVLNTWHGRPEEKWNAHTSSFLQVLVSIQSLILVPEPYFNEPGYERSRGTRAGSAASLEYNSNIYQACVRWAMLDHLRNPSPCFKDVIQAHFWMKRNEIITTVASWISELESQGGDERTQRNVQTNLLALKRHYSKLQEELAKLQTPPGLEDMDEPFNLPAPTSPAPGGTSPPPPPPPNDDEIDLEKIVSQVLD